MAAGQGFKTFATGDVLTAADTNGYLMQGVWVFASAAARDAAVTSPQEGNVCYLKDTDAIMTYSGSAWVAVGSSSSFVGCSVFASAALSTTQSTATILGANSENYDTSGFHDNSTNNSRITIPTGKGGYYKISTYMNAQTAQIAYVLLYKNGSAVALGTDNGQFTGVVSTYGSTGRINGTFDIALAAGDYVQIAVISDAATGNNVTKFVFSAIYLGA